MRRSLYAVLALFLAVTLAAAGGCGSGSGKPGSQPPASGVPGDLQFGQAIEYQGGQCPTVAGTKDGWVVEIHEASRRDELWCHTGRVDPQGGTIAWVGDSFDMGGGVDPSVAITDDGTTVATHRGASSGKLWYQVGKLDKNTGALSWGQPVEYDTGGYPLVTVANDGWVIETHGSRSDRAYYWRFSKELWYKVGKINAGNNTIDFGPTVSLDGSPLIGLMKGANTFIQVDANPTSMRWRFGKIDGGSKTIAFTSEWRQDGEPWSQNGVRTVDRRSVAVFWSDQTSLYGVVTVDQFLSYTLNDNRAWITGQGDDLRIAKPGGRGYDQWHEQRNFDQGKRPAVAAAAGTIVEMHESRASRTIWYSTAKVGE
ncbi:MAG: hypothetical protein ACYC99_16370 [Candidatus Geothermincolia bacterium]